MKVQTKVRGGLAATKSPTAPGGGGGARGCG